MLTIWKHMQKTIFFFGRNPVLSLAELHSLLQVRNPGARIQPLWNNAALVDGLSTEPKKVVNWLGGTTKIARLCCELRNLKTGNVLEELERNNFFNQLEGKFFFSLSRLGKVSEEEQQSVLQALKQGFKKNKQKALLKHGTERKQLNQFVTNPSEIVSWKLLETKTDLAIAKTTTGFLFCQTIAVFNPSEWEWRDENRPHKDNKEIISIRLAKILVNLAGLKEKQTVLDPFCGYGTVLQEALLNGLNGIGIEKEKTKTEAAKQNLSWLAKQCQGIGKVVVYNGDAVQAPSFLKKGDFQAVVTEPHMGPYLAKRPSAEQAQRILNELQALYQKLFSGLALLLNKGERVVFVFPVFELFNHQQLRLPETVFSAWFESTNPLQSMGPAFSRAFPALYQNPKNKLLREIHVLQRK